MSLTLGIETSCDDTSVAIVDSRGHVLAMLSQSQDLKHQEFGGVVPEIAHRNHSLALLPLVDQLLTKAQLTFKQIDLIAVTNRPGLQGSLIVGIIVAKTLSQIHKIPLVGVNHLEGHILAPFLSDDQFTPIKTWQPGIRGLCLAVSGGHSSLYEFIEREYTVLGTTQDDAVGEAFDKVAKLLGLGWPGGAALDKLAQNGNPKAFEFPRTMQNKGLMLSFSGLKSAVLRVTEKLTPVELNDQRADIAASFQEAACDTLMQKLALAVSLKKPQIITLTGGVSANSRLRFLATDWARQQKLMLLIPPIRYCTDNAAMIAWAGTLKWQQGHTDDLSLFASPASLSGDFKFEN